MNELKLEKIINKANEEIEKISDDELKEFGKNYTWFCIKEFRHVGLRTDYFKTIAEAEIQAAKITKRLFIIIDLLKEEKENE